MSDEAAVVAAPLRARVRDGLRQPANWMQLVRFASVGGSGYAINLVVFALCVGPAGHRLAATAAFLVAVTNNFWWNRHWTFAAGGGHAGFQAARFLVVSVAAFGVSLGALELLLAATALPEVGAQAIAIAAVTPLSFLGNKLWSFGR